MKMANSNFLPSQMLVSSPAYPSLNFRGGLFSNYMLLFWTETFVLHSFLDIPRSQRPFRNNGQFSWRLSRDRLSKSGLFFFVPLPCLSFTAQNKSLQSPIRRTIQLRIRHDILLSRRCSELNDLY